MLKVYHTFPLGWLSELALVFLEIAVNNSLNTMQWKYHLLNHFSCSCVMCFFHREIQSNQRNNFTSRWCI